MSKQSGKPLETFFEVVMPSHCRECAESTKEFLRKEGYRGVEVREVAK